MKIEKAKVIEIIQNRIESLEKSIDSIKPYGNDGFSSTTAKNRYYELKENVQDYTSLIKEIESINN